MLYRGDDHHGNNDGKDRFILCAVSKLGGMSCNLLSTPSADLYGQPPGPLKKRKRRAETVKPGKRRKNQASESNAQSLCQKLPASAAAREATLEMSPNSMRTLADAAEYVSTQDAQLATASTIALQPETASREVLIAEMDSFVIEGDGITVDPRIISRSEPRPGGQYLYGVLPEFRPGGSNPMIDGSTADGFTVDGSQEAGVWRGDGSVRLFFDR